MLDYRKITFNEIDDTDKPLQAFYNYDLSREEIEDFVEKYATEDEVPRGMYLFNIELCLSIYSAHDFKLEAVVTNDNAEQFWIEISKQFTNADEFIQMIPDYGKLHVEVTER